MKIPYKKERDYFDLFHAIAWCMYGYVGLSNNLPSWIGYVTIIVSFSYLLFFIFNKKIYYLTVNNGILRTGIICGKKINLSEITQITRDSEYFILKAGKVELTINMEIIDQNSLTKLNAELEKLNVESN